MKNIINFIAENEEKVKTRYDNQSEKMCTSYISNVLNKKISFEYNKYSITELYKLRNLCIENNVESELIFNLDKHSLLTLSQNIDYIKQFMINVNLEITPQTEVLPFIVTCMKLKLIDNPESCVRIRLNDEVKSMDIKLLLIRLNELGIAEVTLIDDGKNNKLFNKISNIFIKHYDGKVNHSIELESEEYLLEKSYKEYIDKQYVILK